jgi:hypothetical protein
MRSVVNAWAGTFVPMIAAGNAAVELRTEHPTANKILAARRQEEGFIEEKS